MTAPNLSLDANPAVGPFFVIARDNARVHIYRDVQSMLAAADAGTSSPSTFEFFDVQGRRLTPLMASSTMTGLRPTGDQPDIGAVQARLRAVIQHLTASVDERLARATNPPGTREQALAVLPQLDGKALGDCFELLRANFGDGARSAGNGAFSVQDNGSFWHNFWCH